MLAVLGMSCTTTWCVCTPNVANARCVCTYYVWCICTVHLHSAWWMDGWNLFRPEARSLKGLGTLNTYNSSVSAVVSHKPLSCPFPQNFPIPPLHGAYA
jgi:hypothetical protein